MFKVVFTFDVPEEDQAGFLKFSREGTKPYWEAHGAISYDVWQTEEGSPGFIKEMYVEDRESALAIFKRAGTDPEAKALVDRWEGFTVNLNRKLYELKT